MNKEKSTRITAGTIAGWAIVTVGQPLDYLKTMYQVTQHLPSIKQIYNSIGLKGFYKGASSIYLFCGFTTALQFQTFQRTSHFLMKRGFIQKNNEPDVFCLMMSGFMTGAVCSFIYTPTQYVKIHSQIQRKSKLGSAQMIFRVLYEQKLRGLKKLYTGHSITLIKQSIGSVFYYAGYHIVLTRIFQQKRQQAKLWSQLISGGIAGILYQLYSYPVDTIKTNVQSGKSTITEMFRSKFWATSNFRNGLKISLLRSFIVDATNFSVYQNLRRLLLRGYNIVSKE